MAAFTGTPTGSTQYNSTPMQYTNYVKAVFSYTHAAGAGTGEVNLLKLPAGKIVIYSADSRIATSAMATGADIHLGYRAYVEPDGDAVVESQQRLPERRRRGDRRHLGGVDAARRRASRSSTCATPRARPTRAWG